DNHAADVVTGLTEEGKAATRALRIDFIRPASEHACLLAVGTAQAKRAVKGTAKGRAACFLHLGQSGCYSVPTRDTNRTLIARLPPVVQVLRNPSSHGHMYDCMIVCGHEANSAVPEGRAV